MGKLTISMAMFNSKLFVYQRVVNLPDAIGSTDAYQLDSTNLSAINMVFP